MATAEDIARYILYLAQQEPEPELISPMRLHKLVYYCQAWNLAMRDEPLFDDRIEAWRSGPVMRSLRQKFADYGDQAIAECEARSDLLKPYEWAMVESIWSRYRKYSAGELHRMTHDEQPWRMARGDLSPHEAGEAEITHESMKEYFRSEFDAQAPPGRDSAYWLRIHKEFKAGGGIDLRDAAEQLL